MTCYTYETRYTKKGVAYRYYPNGAPPGEVDMSFLNKQCPRGFKGIKKPSRFSEKTYTDEKTLQAIVRALNSTDENDDEATDSEIDYSNESDDESAESDDEAVESDDTDDEDSDDHFTFHIGNKRPPSGQYSPNTVSVAGKRLPKTQGYKRPPKQSTPPLELVKVDESSEEEETSSDDDSSSDESSSDDEDVPRIMKFTGPSILLRPALPTH